MIQKKRISNSNQEYKDSLIGTNNTSGRQGDGYSNLPQNEDQNNYNTTSSNNNNQQQPGFFSRFVFRPLSYIGSLFCSKCFNKKDKKDRGDEDNSQNLNLNDFVLKDMPGKVESSAEFNACVKKQVGVFILYNSKQMTDFRLIIQKMNSEENSYLKEIISINYKVYLVSIDSMEGKRVHKYKLTHYSLYPYLPLSA